MVDCFQDFVETKTFQNEIIKQKATRYSTAKKAWAYSTRKLAYDRDLYRRELYKLKGYVNDIRRLTEDLEKFSRRAETCLSALDSYETLELQRRINDKAAKGQIDSSKGFN